MWNCERCFKFAIGQGINFEKYNFDSKFRINFDLNETREQCSLMKLSKVDSLVSLADFKGPLGLISNKEGPVEVRIKSRSCQQPGRSYSIRNFLQRSFKMRGSVFQEKSGWSNKSEENRWTTSRILPSMRKGSVESGVF